MPTRPAKNCRRNGCPNRTDRGYCDTCRKQRERARTTNRGSSTQRGYGVAHRRRREATLQRDPYCKCRGCGSCNRIGGCWRPSNQSDHIVPKHLGGSDDLENYQGLCDRCHDEKTLDEVGWTYSGRRRHAATVVCGPPASGKTTFVGLNRKPGDVAYDFDAIAVALIGDAAFVPDDRDFIAPLVTAARDALFRTWKEKSRGLSRHLWVILSGASPDQRRNVKHRLHAGVVVLEVDADECKARIEREAREDAQGRAEAVDRWWHEYEPSNGDKVIRTRAVPTLEQRAC